MTKAGQVSSALIPTAPLLLTESKDEFNLIRDNLNDQIKPRGIIEQMYIEDIAYLVWEILRLRRSKAAIVNSAFRDALTDVVEQLLRNPGQWRHELKGRPEKLARAWFSDSNVKKQIAGLLRQFNLDETAIEAEAFRKSAETLERIDRLMASAEARRDKALVCIAQYCGDFGALLRESSDRLVDGTVLERDYKSPIASQNSPGAETHVFPFRRLEHAGSK
jgi:hypothetical protein